MTRFDLLVLLFLLVSAGIGWFRGGIREAVTLAAIGAGFVAINLFAGPVTEAVPGVLRKLIAIAGLFLAGDLLVSIFGAVLVRKYFGRDPTRNDKIAGGLFGLVRGWVLAAFVLFTVQVYHEGTELPPMIAKSLFAPALDGTAQSLIRKGDVSFTELSNAVFWTISPLSDFSGT